MPNGIEISEKLLYFEYCECRRLVQGQKRIVISLPRKPILPMNEELLISPYTLILFPCIYSQVNEFNVHLLPG